MGAYRRWVPVPHHTAKVDEIMEDLWSDYYGAALFGDEREIACLPHKGCRLEIVATAESSHDEVNLILPGHVVRHSRRYEPYGSESPRGSMLPHVRSAGRSISPDGLPYRRLWRRAGRPGHRSLSSTFEPRSAFPVVGDEARDRPRGNCRRNT